MRCKTRLMWTAHRLMCAWPALLLLGAAALCACHGPASPTETPTASDPLAGTWVGTIHDRESGSGILRVSLSGGLVVTGTWSAAIGGRLLSGPASLAPPGAPARALTLTCESAPSHGAVGVIVSVSGSTLEGNYFALDCPGLVGGSIALQKQ